LLTGEENIAMKYFNNLRDKTVAWTVPGSVHDREKETFLSS
jgi:hypothetical protein